MLELTGAARPDIALRDVPDYIVNHDIFLFLVQNLANFRFPEEELRRLVQKAAGLFIWADTACRFITNGELFGNAYMTSSRTLALALPQRNISMSST